MAVPETLLSPYHTSKVKGNELKRLMPLIKEIKDEAAVCPKHPHLVPSLGTEKKK